MLYPLLKIPTHYSASDRARKVRNKNLKSAFEKSMKNQQKKKINPPKKKRFLKITAFPLTKKAKKGFFIKPSQKIQSKD